MLALLFTSIVAASVPSSHSALDLCRPAMAKKAEGEIADVSIARTRKIGRTRQISGKVTVFVGMGPAPAGTARAHHLIRAEYDYRCSVRSGRVIRLTMNQ